MLKEEAEVVCLIKPQFEAGKEQVGKKGVVRDSKVHEEVIKKVIDHAKSIGFSILNLDYSPITGPEGNIEYLLHLRKVDQAYMDKNTSDIYERIKDIVGDSHDTLSL